MRLLYTHPMPVDRRCSFPHGSPACWVIWMAGVVENRFSSFISFCLRILFSVEDIACRVIVGAARTMGAKRSEHVVLPRASSGMAQDGSQNVLAAKDVCSQPHSVPRGGADAKSRMASCSTSCERCLKTLQNSTTIRLSFTAQDRQCQRMGRFRYRFFLFV